jgi:hypothetical protein
MVKMRLLLSSAAALAMLMLQGVSGTTAPRPGVDWPQFRGIRASGIDDRHPAPSSWDVSKNQLVRWKTPIPGLGHASPVIWGDTLYIATSISGQKDAGLKVGYYGDIDPVKDETPHEWRVYALDKKTGKVQWQRTVLTVSGSSRSLARRVSTPST